MTTMSPLSRIFKTMIAVGVVTVFVAIVPATASAVMTCTFAGGALSLTRTGSGSEELTLRTSGPAPAAIQFVLDGTTPVICPGSPTVANTASISYTHTSGIVDMKIEDPDRFAPGTGGPAEGAGAAEIEIALTETGGILSDVDLVDTDGLGQTYALGSLGVNFNPGEPAPDVDLTLTGFFPTIRPIGGPGADRFDLRGGAGTGTTYTESLALSGGGGNDQLFIGSSTYEVDGGPGDDLIDGTANSNERVVYSTSTSPVKIDLAQAGPQDGGSLGRDTLIGIDEVVGSNFGDVLLASSGDEALSGGPGDDLLEGRAGDDSLDGGGGIDTLSYASAPSGVTIDLDATSSQETGGAGEDYLYNGEMESLLGSAFADTLIGSSGINRIDGGAGTDTIKAQGGDDEVLARDGAADTVDCGAGSDEGVFDQQGLDKIVACEAASFRDVEVKLVVGGAKKQKLGKRGVGVTVRCPEEACTVRLAAKAKVKGRRKAFKFKGVGKSLSAGKATTLRPAIGKRARASIAKALRAGRKVTVRVSVTATDAAGNRQTVIRLITLKSAGKAKKPKPGKSA